MTRKVCTILPRSGVQIKLIADNVLYKHNPILPVLPQNLENKIILDDAIIVDKSKEVQVTIYNATNEIINLPRNSTVAISVNNKFASLPATEEAKNINKMQQMKIKKIQSVEGLSLIHI